MRSHHGWLLTPSLSPICRRDLHGTQWRDRHTGRWPGITRLPIDNLIRPRPGRRSCCLRSTAVPAPAWSSVAGTESPRIPPNQGSTDVGLDWSLQLRGSLGSSALNANTGAPIAAALAQ